MGIDAVRFTEPQQKKVDEIVEGRLAHERRIVERERKAERETHGRELAALRIELERARSERSIMSGLLERWFGGSPRPEGSR